MKGEKGDRGGRPRKLKKKNINERQRSVKNGKTKKERQMKE